MVKKAGWQRSRNSTVVARVEDHGPQWTLGHSSFAEMCRRRWKNVEVRTFVSTIPCESRLGLARTAIAHLPSAASELVYQRTRRLGCRFSEHVYVVSHRVVVEGGSAERSEAVSPTNLRFRLACMALALATLSTPPCLASQVEPCCCKTITRRAGRWSLWSSTM